MVAVIQLAAASKPRLTRYWVSDCRDYNGRLPAALHVRIEWIEASGHVRTNSGTYFADDRTISWHFGEPPASIHNDALDCAYDAGECAKTGDATFEGTETFEEMCDAIDHAEAN